MLNLTWFLCNGKNCPFASYCRRATTKPPKKGIIPMILSPYNGYSCEYFLPNKTCESRK